MKGISSDAEVARCKTLPLDCPGRTEDAHVAMRFLCIPPELGTEDAL